MHAEDRHVVGLGAVTGEDDLARVDPEATGDDLAGLVERLTGDAGGTVRARGVAVALGEERQHRLHGLRTHGGARGVIEVGERVGHRERVRGLGQVGGAKSPGSAGTSASGSDVAAEGSAGRGISGGISGGGSVPPIVRLRS